MRFSLGLFLLSASSPRCSAIFSSNSMRFVIFCARPPRREVSATSRSRLRAEENPVNTRSLMFASRTTWSLSNDFSNFLGRSALFQALPIDGALNSKRLPRVAT